MSPEKEARKHRSKFILIQTISASQVDQQDRILKRQLGIELQYKGECPQSIYTGRAFLRRTEISAQ